MTRRKCGKSLIELVRISQNASIIKRFDATQRNATQHRTQLNREKLIKVKVTFIVSLKLWTNRKGILKYFSSLFVRRQTRDLHEYLCLRNIGIERIHYPLYTRKYSTLVRDEWLLGNRTNTISRVLLDCLNTWKCVNFRKNNSTKSRFTYRYIIVSIVHR